MSAELKLLKEYAKDLDESAFPFFKELLDVVDSQIAATPVETGRNMISIFYKLTDLLDDLEAGEI